VACQDWPPSYSHEAASNEIHHRTFGGVRGRLGLFSGRRHQKEVADWRKEASRGLQSAKPQGRFSTHALHGMQPAHFSWNTVVIFCFFRVNWRTAQNSTQVFREDNLSHSPLDLDRSSRVGTRDYWGKYNRF